MKTETVKGYYPVRNPETLLVPATCRFCGRFLLLRDDEKLIVKIGDKGYCPGCSNMPVIRDQGHPDAGIAVTDFEEAV